MFKIHEAAKTSLWRKVLMGLAGMAMAGCASSSPCNTCVALYAHPQPAPADYDLQACANHAAAGVRASGQEGFKRLKLETAGRYKAPLQQYVGNTYIQTVQDGYGQWYGTKEWRAVRYHCLSDGAGQVLYSFVRAE